MINRNIIFAAILFGLACFGFLPGARAVSPAPDGGYAGGNTAEGSSALLSLTAGTYNTAIGLFSLLSLTDGSFCTGLGAGTLLANTGGENTASGAGALLSNSTGLNNTANGAFALFSNTIGVGNTATGSSALFSNTTANDNTAVGASALFSNTEGSGNTALGESAMQANTTGYSNTAIGDGSLQLNTTGASNTANGSFALLSNTVGGLNSAFGAYALLSNISSLGSCAFGHSALRQNDSSGSGMANENNAFGFEALDTNVDGSGNNGFGFQALHNNVDGFGNSAFGDSALVSNVSGDLNTAIGDVAGNLIDGNGNVCIGANVLGNSGENNITRIKNIGSNPIVGGVNVVITGTSSNGDFPLGYASSSRRYKEDIRTMDNASETLFALKPVSFRARADSAHVRHYGLIAEDVSAVNPDLVVYNPEGKPETLRFDSINAMLLNEFLKEHRKGEQQDRKIEGLETTAALLQTALKEQAAQLQKVSTQIELNRQAPQQVVSENSMRR